MRQGLIPLPGQQDLHRAVYQDSALILNHLWGLPVGIMTLVLNVPLVLISYKVVGKKFLLEDGGDHAYFNVFLDLVFPFFPMYRGQRLLAAVYSGVLLGGGMVLFYLRGSSSGGIDFLTMAIKKKHPSISLGKITLLIDLAVILLGWPVFGDVDAVLYGLISTFASVVVIDKSSLWDRGRNTCDHYYV